MKPRNIDWSNFHDATLATFGACEPPTREPDFVSDSGSQYWNTGDGVIRRSDHWGNGIRSCDWHFYGPATMLPLTFADGTVAEGYSVRVADTGFCRYADFVDKVALAAKEAARQQRADFRREPKLSRLRYKLCGPAKPLSGHGFERVALPAFNTKAGRRWQEMWKWLPDKHKLEWHGRFAGRFVSPEAYSAMQQTLEVAP